MKLPYDPTHPTFFQSILALPGYPQGEPVRLKKIWIEAGALERLPVYLESLGLRPGAQRLLAVMDPTPMRRQGDSLKPLLVQQLQAAGYRTEVLVLDPDASGQVHTDFLHIQAVKVRLRPGMVVLSIGSGVVTDIAKHACHLYETDTGEALTFVVYQTANSVNAYTSNMAPTFVDGVKRTLASRYADALVCDLETLRDAPPAMTAAGVGDLLSAAVSFPDWYLAHRLGLDPGYSPLPQALMGPFLPGLEAAAEDIRSGEPEATALLAKLIHLSGLCMSLAHATTPFSGFEHVLSHILDLQNELSGRPLAQHGSQVGLAAVLGAKTYRLFLGAFDPTSIAIDACYPSPAEMQRRVSEALSQVDPSGKAGAECWRDYEVKLSAWHAHREHLPTFLEAWPEVRAELQRLAYPAAALLRTLAAVGAPVRFEQLAPPAAAEQVRCAYHTAALMRRRLTIGDALIFFGWDREKLWQQVSERVL